MLHLAPASTHTLGTLRTFALHEKLSASQPAEGVVSINIPTDELRRVTIKLVGVLSSVELRTTKSLLLPANQELTLASMMHTVTLEQLVAQVQGDWLINVIRNDGLFVHFQPIVAAASPGDVFAYECLVRGREENGDIIYPGAMFQVARDAGYISLLDRETRVAAIRNAAELAPRSKLFINFNPSSVYDPAYCLRSTRSAVEEAGLGADRVVFEVVESDHVEDVAHLLGILNFYRNAGFQVALDDLGAGYGSLNLLTRLRPDYVKLDAELVRDVDRDPYKAQVAQRILDLANELSIQTVAECIETQGEFDWFTRNGATYLQGYYIARPATPPPAPRRSAMPSPVLE